ncbi:MAG: PhaM family polyhydroxyalkanoate granule multifunctional regulatory protein, partial [Pseudomonadota bacterium]
MTPLDVNALQAAFAPYARYIPGFAFLQGLAGGGGGDAPPMAQWVAPVFDVEELDRRIRDLKAVHFWLEQNARALQATIQALEVQKMTLATLQGMNVSLGEVGQALAAAAAAAATPATASAPAPTRQDAAAAAPGAAAAPAPAAAEGAPGVDPVRWWRSLTEQFQAIATQAMQDMTQHAATAAASAVARSATPGAPPADPVAPTATPTTAPAPRPAR